MLQKSLKLPSSQMGTPARRKLRFAKTTTITVSLADFSHLTMVYDVSDASPSTSSNTRRDCVTAGPVATALLCCMTLGKSLNSSFCLICSWSCEKHLVLTSWM